MANIYQDPAMKTALARIIRAQMDLEGLTYKNLCDTLEKKFGIEHNPDTLRNKVSSGALGAQMFLFMMLAMEVENLNVSDIQKMYRKIKKSLD